MPLVYILKSLKDGKFYYGSTKSIERRMKEHNSGMVRSTKSRRPLVLHYIEEYPTLKEARKREIFFKSINGYIWLREKKIIELE
jgi:putative endonuclease